MGCQQGLRYKHSFVVGQLAGQGVKGGELEEKGQKGKKPQRKGDLVPEPKWASRAGGKMAKEEVSERSDQAAPQDTAQREVQQPKAKKRATESEEAAKPNRQQQPAEAGHCPRPKGRTSRKQRD